MRTIEKAHGATDEVRHTELQFEQLPKALRKLIEQRRAELQVLDCELLLTGARLRLHEGGANTHYQIWRSTDGLTSIDLSHVQIGRVFALWPVPLPFPKLTGVWATSIAIESMFSNDSTVISTTSKDVIQNPLPKEICIAMAELTPEQTLAEMCRLHAEKREEVLANNPKLSVKPLDSREAHFEKERIQRALISEMHKKWLKQLREESNADLWDKPAQ